jgi:hypothetical protein
LQRERYAAAQLADGPKAAQPADQQHQQAHRPVTIAAQWQRQPHQQHKHGDKQASVKAADRLGHWLGSICE